MGKIRSKGLMEAVLLRFLLFRSYSWGGSLLFILELLLDLHLRKHLRGIFPQEGVLVPLFPLLSRQTLGLEHWVEHGLFKPDFESAVVIAIVTAHFLLKWFSKL